MNEDDYMLDAPPPPPPKPVKRDKPAKQPPEAAAAPSEPAEAAPRRGRPGKDKPTNKRLGRIKKGKEGEPAQFEPGGSHGAKNFDAAALAEELKIWWENDGGDSFILQIEDELWSRWPASSIVKEIKERLKGRVWHERRDGEQLSEMDRLLLYVRKQRCVHRLVHALAGYKSGVHENAGGRFIVATSPKIIQPVKGDWSMIRQFIEGRLLPTSPGYQPPDDEHPLGRVIGWQNQATMFYLWLKSSYLSLVDGEPGSRMGGHLLVLAGPGDCGKSRIQTNIVTPILGGRSADPTAFLTNADTFNSDMIEAEHQQMEELQSGSQKTTDRVMLSEAFKRMVATEMKRVRLMRNDPFTVEPFWRPTLSINNDPDKLRAFPMLTPDFRDKVLMLDVAQVPLPMPTDTPAERKAWNDRVKAELPAFVWWLVNEFKVPDELLVDENGRRATRFGFRYWQHPSLVAELFEDTPAAQLIRLIDACELVHQINGTRKLWELSGPHNNLAGRKLRVPNSQGETWVPDDGVWCGTALDLEKWLTSEMAGWKSSVEKEALKLFKFTAVDRILSRLKEDRIDRVAQGRKNHARVWTISRPGVE